VCQSAIQADLAVLTLLLATAGLLKVVDPRPFGWAMFRVVPPGWRGWRVVPPGQVGRLVGGLELTVAITVLIAPGEWRWTGELAMTTLYLAFVGVVLSAVRTGMSCGCWGSFSDGVAAGGELARSIALAALAAGGAIGRLFVDPAWQMPAVLVWGAALATFVLLSARVGARRWPQTGRRPPRNMLLSSEAGIARDLALLAGLLGHSLSDRRPRVVRLRTPQRAGRPDGS
jgi:hypothetical protein